MSYTTGIELRKGRISKADALKKVYRVRAIYKNNSHSGGVCTFPKALVGLRFKLVEVKECQMDK